MADHVRRCEVAHDELVFILLYDLSNLVCDTLDAHRWLFIVGRDLGRRDHVALLVLELLLNTAVEEERDVRVLLGLGDMCLLDALLSEPLREDVRHRLGREGDGEAPLLVVAGHGGDVLHGTGHWQRSESRHKIRTRFLGMSTSVGLSGRPKSATISRIRSER